MLRTFSFGLLTAVRGGSFYVGYINYVLLINTFVFCTYLFCTILNFWNHKMTPSPLWFQDSRYLSWILHSLCYIENNVERLAILNCINISVDIEGNFVILKFSSKFCRFSHSKSIGYWQKLFHIWNRSIIGLFRILQKSLFPFIEIFDFDPYLTWSLYVYGWLRLSFALCSDRF